MKTLRLLLLSAALVLGACAGVSTQVVRLNPSAQFPQTSSVEVLLQKPTRPHVEIALLESRGTSEAAMLNDAREKAAQLGANAIVRIETERIYHPPVAVYDPWIDPLWYGYHPYRPFAIHPHPWGAYRMVGGGYSYVLKSTAIRYSEN